MPWPLRQGGFSANAIKTIEFARIYEGADLNHDMNLLSGARSYAEHIFKIGPVLRPRVILAYHTHSPKSRRSLTLYNAFLHLRCKKSWNGKNFEFRGSPSRGCYGQKRQNPARGLRA